ncbi:MAG: Galactose-phosphate uridylyltransferase [Planctomycetota bacterium]
MTISQRHAELRVDVLTGRRVIVVPGRAARPNAIHRSPELSVAADPFAEGSEAHTPDECLAIRPQQTPPNGPGWLLRVVPNRYPITGSETEAEAEQSSADVDSPTLFPAAAFHGRHEVVIECPDSRTRMLQLSPTEVVRVLQAWRHRCQTLIAADRYRTLAVYRNEGFSAGASLPHCHSQILAARSLAQLDQIRLQRAADYQAVCGGNLLSDLLAAEDRLGSRVVLRTAQLFVLCPFAPRTAWHVRFAPWPASPAFFKDATDCLLTELAALLLQVLRALEAACGSMIAFNLIINQHPVDRPAAWSWTLDLLPRLTKQAGWELITDEDTLPGRPEEWAERLRSLLQTEL